MGLNQLVLSHYLSRLNNSLSVLLFEKGRGRFLFTSEGYVVYQKVKAITTTLNDFANYLTAIKQQVIGTVKLAVWTIQSYIKAIIKAI